MASSKDIKKLGRKGHFFSNWAEVFFSNPELYFEPGTSDEIRQILEDASENNKKVKVVGCGHSPSDLACTDDYMISLRKMNKVLELDKENCTVKVEGGITVAEMNEILAENDMAMTAMGVVPEITLAGAISTGTHGSGAAIGIMSAYVVELELMTSDGRILQLSEESDKETFLASCLGLGALGIILTITLQCSPAFKLHQTETPVTFNQALDQLEAHADSTERSSLAWFPHTDLVVLRKTTATDKPIQFEMSYFWGVIVGYHLLEFLYYIGTFVPWTIKYVNKLYCCLLHSHKKEFVNVSNMLLNFPVGFKHYVTEWAIPRDKTGVTLRKLKAYLDSGKVYAHMWCEVRFAKKDNIYLSPAYGRETTYLNIVMYRPYGRHVEHSEYFRAFEQIVMEVGGRPHWAKDHTVTLADVKKMYPQWSKFTSIRQKLDPNGMFLNKYLLRYFGEEAEKA